MAILQSIDGRFYQLPDDEADKFLVPADKVEETLRAVGAAQPQQAAPAAPAAGGIPVGSGSGPVIIYVVGGGAGAPGGGMPMGAPQQMGGPQQMGAPADQVQAYAHHHHHHGHHGGHHGGWWGGWGGGWGGCYNNYYNYRNYYNYWCW
jgi:hypothetical protein